MSRGSYGYNIITYCVYQYILWDCKQMQTWRSSHLEFSLTNFSDLTAVDSDEMPWILLIGQLKHTKNLTSMKWKSAGIIWYVITWSCRCIISRRLLKQYKYMNMEAYFWSWHLDQTERGTLEYYTNHTQIKLSNEHTMENRSPISVMSILRTCCTWYLYTCYTICVNNIM